MQEHERDREQAQGDEPGATRGRRSPQPWPEPRPGGDQAHRPEEDHDGLQPAEDRKAQSEADQAEARSIRDRGKRGEQEAQAGPTDRVGERQVEQQHLRSQQRGVREDAGRRPGDPPHEFRTQGDHRRKGTHGGERDPRPAEQGEQQAIDHGHRGLRRRPVRLLQEFPAHDPLEVQHAAGGVVPDRAGRERAHQEVAERPRDREPGGQREGVDEPGAIDGPAGRECHPGIIWSLRTHGPGGVSEGGAGRLRSSLGGPLSVA